MANERRIVELVLKAIGDTEVKRMTAELVKMRGAAEQSQKSLEGIEAAGFKLGQSIKNAFSGLAALAGQPGGIERIDRIGRPVGQAVAIDIGEDCGCRDRPDHAEADRPAGR